MSRIKAYSLRTVVIVITAVAIWCGLIAARCKQYRLQEIALQEVSRRSGSGDSHMNFREASPSWFWKKVCGDCCQDVTSINSLRGNITDADLRQLVLDEVSSVGLSGPDVTDDAMQMLRGSRLQKIRLYGTGVTETGIAKLPIDNLTYVQLNDMPLGNAVLATIAKGRAVRDLGIHGLSVDDDGLRHLRGMELLSLGLGEMRVTDAGIQGLGRNERLNWLVCTGTDITDTALMTIAQSFPNLERLNLRGNEWLTSEGVQHLTQLQKLSWLSLRECKGIDAKVMKHVLAIKALSHVELGGTSLTLADFIAHDASKPDHSVSGYHEIQRSYFGEERERELAIAERDWQESGGVVDW